MIERLLNAQLTMNTLSFTIRQATPKDARHISKIGRKVFIESYQYPYNNPDMEKYLKENLSTEKILKDLDTNTVYYFVAQTDSIVGFVKFNTWMWSPRYKGKLTFEVERLYIQKDMEAQGIGSSLMTKAIETGKQKGYSIIWLSVWDNNTKGISFHKRHGFEIVGNGEFVLGMQKRKYLIMQLKENDH